MTTDLPAWLRELHSSLCTAPQFVLAGNVRDRVLLPEPPDRVRTVELIDAIWEGLQPSGLECLLVFDLVDGLRVFPAGAGEHAAASRILGRELSGEALQLTLEELAQHIARVVESEEGQAAFVIDYASRIALAPQQLTPEQHAFFFAIEKLSRTARSRSVPARDVPIFNPAIWLVENERDLPDWLTARNDGFRVCAVPLPDLGQRRKFAARLAEGFDDYRAADKDTGEELVDRFAAQTEGMTVRAMLAINRLAKDQPAGMHGIDDAVRCHRIGITDDPWGKPEMRDRIVHAEELIRRRVIGQSQAVRQALDILMRSATGLTGAHASRHAVRPRGVLFFAGPTGVGKTELAKALAELVFGDAQAMTRFDMSEFAEDHTAARLIGAPPGYTGFDAGGELTNAVRRRPLSVILFDEIDKAGHQIFDSFLQILEDGRLTDGRGTTVHFSETILVFTSNLGVYVQDENGDRRLNVDPEMRRPQLEEAIRTAVADFFNKELGRPELLNRFGDSIVVFDFIDRAAGEQIFDLLLHNVEDRVQRVHGARLRLEPEARATLLELALAHPAHGGRRIGTTLESALVNPLARALFTREAAPGGELTVREIAHADDGFTLVLA